MLKLVVDCMGGDNGASVVVSAIKNFLKNNQDTEIIAVGKSEELIDLNGLCEIVDAPDVVPMEAGALEVMRLKNSSMNVAIKTMKDRNCDAIISCGSTGGFLSSATINLKLIPGVERAALLAPFPTKIKGKKVVILDIGASNENKPSELVQFALMGSLYAKAVFGIKEPAVYLLSNGAEASKGSPTGKEAYKLLKEMDFPGFKGNVEAREALDGHADVIVTDGYSGNIFLKSSEGMAKMMAGFMSSMFKKNLWSKLGALHVLGGIKNIKETMDYKSTGGAMLLGVNGVVVKAHGSSDAYCFESALKVAKSLVVSNVNENIRKGLVDENR